MFFPINDHNPTSRRPWMTWGIIAATSAVFLLEFAVHPEHLEAIVYLFGIVPARYSHPEWALSVGLPVDDYWPFLTSLFLHASLLHIVGNMWMLWIFGDNVEDRMGRWRFLAFYLLCGLAAGQVQWWTNPHSTIPTIGASGAIAGVFAAYLMMYPRARVLTLVLLLIWPVFVELPAAVYLVLWFAVQFLSGTASLLGPADMGGVAWWAHIGGFAAGLALYRFFLTSQARRAGGGMRWTQP